MRLQAAREVSSDSDEKETLDDSEEIHVKKLAEEDIEDREKCWQRLQVLFEQRVRTF